MEIKQYLPALKSAELFSGIEPEGLESMLACISAEIKAVSKGEIILRAGDAPRHVGAVLGGQLQIIREDYDGNRSLMAVLAVGDIFAEALCCAGVPESPVTVIAYLDSTVMLMSFERILNICSSTCSFHRALVKNMLGLIAGKNLLMQNHIEILALKSVRAKVTRYLESFAPGESRKVSIPLNREELADFLGVERSALSHELARMKKDGLIEYKKNKFVLKWY